MAVSKGNCSYEFLYQCLVRDVIKKRLVDRNSAYQFLFKWEANHPKSTLRADVATQWSRGNRGKEGEWYDGENKQAAS